MVYAIGAICAALILGLDQFTKHFIVTNYSLSDSHTLVPGLLNLVFVENKGGAWGLAYGYTWLLISLTVIIMIVCLSLLIKVGIQNKLLFWSILLILSGGLGNMSDRIFRGGKVVDFLQFAFWPRFPVFNVADCAVVIGASLLMLFFLFDIYKDYREKKSLSNVNSENE